MIMRIRQQQEQLARLRARLAREDGWAGTVVLIIGTMFLLLLGVQGFVWFNASNAAQIAAQSAYTVARSYESTPEAGQAAAIQLLDSMPGTLRDPVVTVNRTAESVTVTITGQATEVIPGGLIPSATYTLTGPVERWVPAP